MLSPEQVLALYHERRKYYASLHTGMLAIKAIYDGTATVDIPEMDKVTLASVPNLAAQGIDQMASRIAQTMPMPGFTPERPEIRGSVRKAATASRVVSGWWQAERLKLKQAQRARHLVAYGMSPCVVVWDDNLHRPIRQVRNPLETYPNPETLNGTYVPVDCLFAYRRSIGYLMQRGYQNQISVVMERAGMDLRRDDEMLLLEYISEEGRMLVLSGAMQSNPSAPLPAIYFPEANAQKAVLLEYAPTKEAYCTVVVPCRISLDKPQGQFDTMIGMYYQQARLNALELAAVEKGIFPDVYLESRTGEIAKFVDGPHDGRTGLVNIVTGGVIKEQQSTPGYMGTQTIDRLERAQRLTAGLPAEFGGESATNIRTGRRGDAVLSAVIDFQIAEGQDIFSYALEDEDRVAIALAKMYDGDNARTIYVGVGNTTKSVTYKANEVFTTSEHKVTYPVTGTDVNSLVIGLGQRIGTGWMSKMTGAVLDPFITDPEGEHDRIIYEGLEQALVAGIQQKAASGEMSPVTLSQIMQLIVNDQMEPAEAMAKVAEDAAKTQQAQQAAGPPAGPPSAQEMAAPNAAASLTGSPLPGSSPGQQDLAQLFNTLKKTGNGALPPALQGSVA